MTTYVITVPDELPDLTDAFLDAVEPGASGHTLGAISHPEQVIWHHRLGVMIRRIRP